MEKKIVISVGRQFGSRGRQIARRLSEILGIAYYDKEIIDEAARQHGLDPDYLTRTDEQAPGFFDYALAGRFGATRLFGSSQNFIMLSNTIKQIASERSCIFVGRTADYILRDHPNLIKLYIHAPHAFRIEQIAAQYNFSATEAENMIARQDRDRARFYDFFTDKTWGMADSYDLSIDSSKLGVEATSQFLADYVRQRVALFK